MTTDRRKTFNTPLEFWQWAIQFPKKRKATAGPGFGSVYLAEDFHNGVSCYGCWPTQSNVKVPLTAVEDEHGVIEDEKPNYADDQSEIAKWVRYVATGVLTDVEYGGQRLERLIRQIIREEIAAATVQWQKDGVWVNDVLRLKPKGD